jgi:uncharacterized protein (TIGR02270 family)
VPGNYNIVPNVLQQHAEDAAILHATRSALTTAPHVRLKHLRRFDDRLAAQLDGLWVAGDDAWIACGVELERPRPGSVFMVAALALENGSAEQLHRMYALAEAVPESRPGLLAAFGWAEPERLRGVVANLLTSSNGLQRVLGVAATAMHRVDPGAIFARRLSDPDSEVRARALRTVGELGMAPVLSSLSGAIEDDDPRCQFWAAWSAVLLGDTQSTLELLMRIAGPPGPLQARAFQLTIQAMSVHAAHALLQSLAEDPPSIRRLIRGSGLAGDPIYLPWLIGFMTDDKTARLAGESFSLITGLDLAWFDLERKPPQNFESGPNDDPNDPSVEMDEDDGLPWPDQKLIQAWWNANSHRFQPGVRYFMGEPLNRENCLRVLKEGFQRQRIAAAIYLSLLNPGTPLFEWRAPAWRQQRLLATMT